MLNDCFVLGASLPHTFDFGNSTAFSVTRRIVSLPVTQETYSKQHHASPVRNSSITNDSE